MSTGASDGELAITAMAGSFAGAEGLDAFWERIRAARVAPLTRMTARFGVPRQWYHPDLVYMDQAFCLPDDAAGAGEAGDPQVAVGARIVRQALEGVPPAGRAELALVAGTSWTGPSYFERDAAHLLAGLQLPLPDGALRAPFYAPDAQLEAIARAAGIGGPLLAVDTACASSLYALEAALGLVRTGQAPGAVVLGLNVFLPAILFMGFSKLGAFTHDGRCVPFAAGASGMIPGEGVGALLVEPAARALAASRPVLALVRAVGLSADGADRSVFAVGPQGLRLALERAYREVDPAEIDYLEAHGTGTVLGDETELTCLDQFFAPRLEDDVRIPVGSVKGLVGHTLAAAGMAALIKALLMLRERTLPPHLKVEPHPRLRRSCLRLLQEAHPWPAPAGAPRPPRIGISAMGIGAANAHVVLEGFEPDAPAPRRSSASPRPAVAEAVDDPLVFVDLECVLGGTTGAAAWAGAVAAAEGEPASSPLPVGRFSRVLPTLPEGARALTGAFFPEPVVIDAAGLRMGPALLQRIDPLQLLLIDLVRALMARHPAVASSPRTGVVITAPVGGEGTLRGMRRFAYERARQGAGDVVEDELGPLIAPSLTMEGIASGNPNLCSGFPAFHHNLQGFHQTLAGPPPTFWSSVLLARHWLDRRCRSLVLGAGRALASPLDLLEADGRPARSPVGEGVGALLLQRRSMALELGHDLLGTLRAVVPGADAPDWRRACLHAKVDPTSVNVVERCQLGPAEDGWGGGRAQRLAGDLRAASGIETLCWALLAPGRRAVIEVRRGDAPWVTLIIDKDPWRPPEPPGPRLPLEVRLAPIVPAARERAGEDGDWDLPAEQLLAYCLGQLERSGEAVHQFLDAQRQTLLPRHASSDGQAQPLAPKIARGTRNVVLRGPLRLAADSSYQAELAVDEAHPYFFDHPLDHVPGTLLVEGILQLVEVVTGEWLPGRAGEPWVKRLQLRFSRYCEKQRPVVLSLRPPRVGQDGTLALAGDFDQQGARVCSFSLGLALHPPGPPGAEGARPQGGGPPPGDPVPAHLLRKERPENVLVRGVEQLADGTYVCRLRPPPPGHLLAEGSARFFSPLYVVETARQAVRLALTVFSTEFSEQNSSVVSIRLALQQPVPRDEALCYRARKVYSVERIDDQILGEVRMTLCGAAERELGQVALRALHLDDEAYARARTRARTSGRAQGLRPVEEPA